MAFLPAPLPAGGPALVSQNSQILPFSNKPIEPLGLGDQQEQAGMLGQNLEF